MKKIILGFMSLVFAFAIFSVATPAQADIVGPINFESYSLGTINTQDGWTSTGAAGSGCAIYDHEVDSALSTTGFGSQSLRVSNAVTSGCFGDQTFSKSLINAVGETGAGAGVYSIGALQSHFETEFDIGSAVPSAQQPGLFMSVSPDRGDGSRMSYLGFEDVVDGIKVIFYDVQGTGNPANFVSSDLGTFSRSVPHHIKLTFDAIDGPSNDVVKVWIDGILIHTGTSWENYYRYDSEASAEQNVRAVRNVLFRTGGGAVPANLNNGYLIDNLSISSSTSVDIGALCKNNGWKTLFSAQNFKNQGACVSFFANNKNPKAWGDIKMGGVGAQQRMIFVAVDGGATDTGMVEYWNYDYPGPLHYTAPVTCASIDKNTKEGRFMFQIPSNWPGLTDLYVISSVKDGVIDTYAHTSDWNENTARTICSDGGSFASYNVTSGDLIIK